MKTALHSFIFLALLLWGATAQSQCPCPLTGGCCGCGTALELYWVGGAGGSGDYNDPAMWRVGSPAGEIPCQSPCTFDNVYFDNLPNTAVVTVSDALVVCHNMTWTGSNAPRFVSDNVGRQLNIHGDLDIQAGMDFAFSGTIEFTADPLFPHPLVKITTRGQHFRLTKIVLAGADNTVFELQDDLWVDDQISSPGTGYVGALYGGRIYLKKGVFDSNEKNITADYFISLINFTHAYADAEGARASNTPTRGLILTNSTFNIKSSMGESWRLQFSAGNYSVFDATNSRIIFHNVPALSQRTFLGGDNLAYNEVRFEGKGHMLVGASAYSWKQTANVMYFGGNAYAYSPLYVEDLYLMGNEYDASVISVWEAQNVHRALACNDVTLFSNMTFKKKTAGQQLILDKVLLVDVNCDVSGGRTYLATESLKRGTTSPNWVLTPPTSGQRFYFRNQLPANNRSWKDYRNWWIFDGVSFTQSTGCIPSILDDVFFDDLSFPAGGGNVLQIDTFAFCHHFRWLPTTLNGNTFSVPYQLNVFGTFQLQGQMAESTGGDIRLWSEARDSIIGNGARTFNSTQLQRYAVYEIAGDNDVSTIDWYARYFICFEPSWIYSNFTQLLFCQMHPRNRNLDSVQIHVAKWVPHTHIPMFDDYGGASVVYTGNTTLHLDGTYPVPTPTETAEIAGGFCRLPNVIGNCKVNTHYSTTQSEVWGDLLLHESATMGYKTNVTGSMNLYDGNTTLTAGKIYEITYSATSYWYTAGYFNAQGNCKQNIFIKSNSGLPIGFRAINAAGSTFDYTILQGLNNIGTILNTSNSSDLGNNTNWNFGAQAAPIKYYWRARQGDPANYAGDWLDARHWTTNPANLVGDDLCVPGAPDTVIFDNLSYSELGNNSDWNGCTVGNYAICNTLWFKANKRLNAVGSIYLTGSFWADVNVTRYNPGSSLNFIGQGSIRCSGTAITNPTTYFNKVGGNWFLEDDFRARTYFYLQAGTFSTRAVSDMTENNMYFLNSSSAVILGTDSNLPRTMNLYGTVIDLPYRYVGTPWNASVTQNLTFNAGTSLIKCYYTNNVDAGYNFLFGAGDPMAPRLTYNKVELDHGAANSAVVAGYANFHYLDLKGNTNINHNNTIDTLKIYGSRYYRLAQNTTQTLTSPYGTIIGVTGPSNFVNIETTPTNIAVNNYSKFYKDHGTPICLDYVRVKENTFLKQADPNLVPNTPDLPLAPTGWRDLHPLLLAETGINADNVGGTATADPNSIWRFSLPVPVNPYISGDTSQIICSNVSDPLTVTLPLRGNSPYYISYTWSDNLGNSGNSGTNDILLFDNDNNPNTDYAYTFTTTNAACTTTYLFNIRNARCGTFVGDAPVTVRLIRDCPNTLVPVTTADTCYLDNYATWNTFYDYSNKKPIASLLDKVSLADNQALGEVIVNVTVDAGYQTYAGTGPTGDHYMQRHWVITPDNNGPAKVRLYFTQAELANLSTVSSYFLMTGNSLNVATGIRVRKFESGAVDVGANSIVPHTVLDMNNPANAAPFSSTAGIVGIEFEVASFSAFAIEPVGSWDLPLNLLDFSAEAIHNRQVLTEWTTAQEKDMSHFEVEHSANALEFAFVGRVDARNLMTNQSYNFTDEQPFSGVSYYRIKMVNTDQTFEYSPVRAVEITGGKQPVKIFPNPVTAGVLNVSFEATNAEPVQLQIVDALGRVVWQREVTAQIGNNQFALSNLPLAPAAYTLRATGQSFAANIDFIFQK